MRSEQIGIVFIVVGAVVLRTFLIDWWTCEVPQENKEWIHRIWAHRRRVRTDQSRFVMTGLSDCIRATIALFFDLWLKEVEEYSEGNEVAWKDTGLYLTDCGMGRSWTSLAVKGFRVYTYEDDSL